MFISNYRPSLHLWWKRNLVKHQKFCKYYENDYSKKLCGIPDGIVFLLLYFTFYQFDSPVAPSNDFKTICSNNQMYCNLLFKFWASSIGHFMHHNFFQSHTEVSIGNLFKKLRQNWENTFWSILFCWGTWAWRSLSPL